MSETVLSFGAGVNSVAAMLLLQRRGEMPRLAFADHAGEHPDTYAYMRILEELGYSIDRIPALVAGQGIYDYCYTRRIIPSRRLRWCTDKFKLRPLLKALRLGGTLHIGIAADEAHRARVDTRWIARGYQVRFPLIEEGLSREDCLSLIRSEGLPTPSKSGCFFCPLQPKESFRRLWLNQPECFEAAMRLENAVERQDFHLLDRPLDELAREWAGEVVQACQTDGSC